jgi:hypothetical protein
MNILPSHMMYNNMKQINISRFNNIQINIFLDYIINNNIINILHDECDLIENDISKELFSYIIPSVKELLNNYFINYNIIIPNSNIIRYFNGIYNNMIIIHEFYKDTTITKLYNYVDSYWKNNKFIIIYSNRKNNLEMYIEFVPEILYDMIKKLNIIYNI